MNLKFIGTDGFPGLRHGEVYDVLVSCMFREDVISVKWFDGTMGKECRYSSPAAFAANWAKPGKKVVVRKKTKSVEPVKHGKWIWTELGKADRDQFWICPECHQHDFIKSYHCPHCGAIMDGGAK